MINSQKSALAKLRQRAEALMIKKSEVNLNSATTDDNNLHRLIHELEVHKVELEMQNEELSSAMSISQNSVNQLTELYDFAPVIYFTLSSIGEILKINFSGAKALGKDRNRLDNYPFLVFVSEATRPIFNTFLDTAFATNLKQTCEICLSVIGKTPQYLYLSGIVTIELVFEIVAIDITERRQRENVGELSHAILQALGEEGSFEAAMAQVSCLVKRHTAVDAVGIRFQEGDDYPYISSCGFSADFLQKENSLLSCNGNRGLCRGADGRPTLECTCGMIISETYNPDAPYMTKQGSFWINNSLPLLELEAKDDDRIDPRNECIHQGYLSVALIPIRAKSKVMGLLQLNAKSENAFSLEILEMVEMIADNIGEAFLRKQVELEFAESAEKYRILFAHNPQPSMIYDSKTLAFLEVNNAAIEHYGYTEAEFLSMTIKDIRSENELPILMKFLSEIKDESYLIQDVKHRKKNGEEIVVDITAHDLTIKGKSVRHIVITDMTERIEREKKLLDTKQKLRQQNQLLETLIQQLPVGVMMVEAPSGKPLLLNEMARQFLGRDLLQEANKENMADVYKAYKKESMEPYPNHETPIMLGLQGEFSKVDDLIIVRPDGSKAQLEISGSPVFDSNGEVWASIASVSDITHRKQAEMALSKSEEKFRTLANHTTDWEFWINPQGEFVYCSPSCKKITGYDASRFMQNEELFLELVHPADRHLLQFYNFINIHSQLSNEEIQFRIVRSDGAIRWIGHICQLVYDEDNNYLGIRGSNRDISYRKYIEQLILDSERKHKLLIENITDGVFSCLYGTIVQANQAMSTIFGYHDSELEGMQLLKMVNSDDQHALELFINSHHTESKSFQIELLCTKKNFSVICVDFRLSFDAQKQIVYGIAHDITEKKQIQKRNMVKAIIQTEEREKAHFAKELHDGIGPLLSTIKLYLQWLNKSKDDHGRQEILLKTEQVIEDALTSVKEISYKLSPHLLTNHGLTSAIQGFANKLAGTNSIKIELKSNLTRRLEMEIEVAFYRGVIECINNTLKYANAQNIHIYILESDSNLLLEYRDDGDGFNLSKALMEQKGLGLYNLQNRIQTIGGSLDLFSEPGSGVCFKMEVGI